MSHGEKIQCSSSSLSSSEKATNAIVGFILMASDNPNYLLNVLS